MWSRGARVRDNAACSAADAPLSRIVATVTQPTSECVSASRSPRSRSRDPTRNASRSGTGLNPGTERANGPKHRPVATASAIPSRNPLAVVSGVLKSPCPSNQAMPVPGPVPASAPTAQPQFPDSTMGNAPCAIAPRTSAATARCKANVVPISVRNPGGASTSAESTSIPCARRRSAAAASLSGPAPMRTPRFPESYGTTTSRTCTTPSYLPCTTRTCG